MTIPKQSDAPLAEIRRVRAEMREAMIALENAIAAPVGHGDREWVPVVTRAVVDLREALDEHVEATEGSDGLYAAVMTDAPRLASAMKRLAAEHVELSAMLDDLSGLLLRDESAIAVRESATTLITRIARHRQRGADMIYEAYEVDIGGE